MQAKIIKPPGLGPPIDSQPLGWAPENSYTRGAEFLKKCSINPELNFRGFGNYNVTLKQKSPAEINYPRLAQAMDCFKCHNGYPRGRLHESYNMSNLEFKVGVDRSMPHGPDGVSLTIDERLALISCLQAERKELQETWRKSGFWMEEASCYGKQFEGAPPAMPGKNKPSGSSTSNKAGKQ